MGKKIRNYTDYMLEKNNKFYNETYLELKTIAISRFTWYNLPISVPSEYIEQTLYRNGFVICYEQGGVIIFSSAVAVEFNHYNEPIVFRTISRIPDYNGILRTISECVIIKNDTMMNPSSIIVNEYTRQLVEMQKLFEQNRELLKVPVIISCPNGQKLSMEKIIQQKDNGEWFILTHKDLNSLGVTMSFFNTNVDNNLGDYLMVQRRIRSNFLTRMGVNNVAIEKKERLLQGESEENDEIIKIYREEFLIPRIKACNEINTVFGTDISIEFNGEVENFE